jgi:3-oxo-5-alpha-steroid 4-dehydrogenase 1
MIEILLTLLGLYTLLFLLSVWLEDNSIADIFWGAGFVIITVMSLLMLKHAAISQLVLSALVVLWGVRLLMYIGRKKSHHS